jgi:DNA-binding transcriptional regulator YhcF (GntR family)
VRREAVESPGLDIAVDRDAEIPIGVQLAWALRTRIRDGQLEPGERLPGLREAAQATGVNVNTVRAVYQRLEQEGLIDSQQGSGTFVAAVPHRRSTVGVIAADAAREAHETGVDPREVAAALYVAPSSPARSSTAAATRRRALREQIAALERTLGEMEAKHPGVAPSTMQAEEDVGPALLDVAELERVRTLLVRRLAEVQAAVDRLGSAEVGEEAAWADAERADEEKREAAPAGKRAARARPRSRPAPAGA